MIRIEPLWSTGRRQRSDWLSSHCTTAGHVNVLSLSPCWFSIKPTLPSGPCCPARRTKHITVAAGLAHTPLLHRRTSVSGCMLPVYPPFSRKLMRIALNATYEMIPTATARNCPVLFLLRRRFPLQLLRLFCITSSQHSQTIHTQSHLAPPSTDAPSPPHLPALTARPLQPPSRLWSLSQSWCTPSRAHPARLLLSVPWSRPAPEQELLSS